MRLLEIKPGDVVGIVGFDDIPDHQFQVEEVYEDPTSAPHTAFGRRQTGQRPQERVPER